MILRQGLRLTHSAVLHVSVIVIAGVLLRLAFLTRVPVFLLHDSGGYHLPAWDLANGLPFDLTPRRTPGYPLFLTGVIRLAGEDLMAIAFIQHLLGLAVALLTYLIGRRIVGPLAAWIVGVIVALEGTLLVAEHYVMPETFFTLLILLSTWLTLMSRSQASARTTVALGLTLGCTILVRPVGLVLTPIAVLALITTALPWRRRVTLLGLLLLGLGVIVGPWIIRNSIVHGQASMSTTLPKSLLARTAKHDRGYVYFTPAMAERIEERRELQARQIIQAAINQRLSDGEIYDRLGERLRLSDSEVDQLLRNLTVNVIQARPWYFVQGSLGFTWELLVGDIERLRADWKTQNARLSRDEWEDRVEHLLRKASPQQDADFPLSEALVDLVQPSRLGAALPVLMLLGWIAAVARRGGEGLLVGLIPLLLIAAPATLDGPVARYRYPADPLLMLLTIGSVLAVPAVIGAFRRRPKGTIHAESGAPVQQTVAEHS